MKLFLLLFVIKSIQSKIFIDIFADNENPAINFTGTGIQNCTSRDLKNLYLINNDLMKYYVSVYYNSTIPRKVFYTSTTRTKSNVFPSDVYKRFGWNPVTLESSIKSARTKYVREGKSLLLHRNFKNPTNVTKKVNAGIEMPVAITLETAWSMQKYEDENYELNHDFVYDINVNFNKNSGTTGITHTSTFGKPSRVHELVNIGRRQYEVELKPGQSVIAKFSAKVCNLAMKVEVLTSVSGNLAVHFKEVVNGRHWLGPKIEDVLKNLDENTESHVKETLVIELGYYYDVKVEVYDKATGRLL